MLDCFQFILALHMTVQQLTTVCYINAHPRSQRESECRSELEDFLRQGITSTRPQPDVAFSHVPLDELSPVANLKSRLLSSLVGVRFIFSGHIHHQKYSSHSTPAPVKNHDVAGTNLMGRVVHEITVPTCSYRMGEVFMGVGAAVLSEFT